MTIYTMCYIVKKWFSLKTSFPYALVAAITFLLMKHKLFFKVDELSVGELGFDLGKTLIVNCYSFNNFS